MTESVLIGVATEFGSLSQYIFGRLAACESVDLAKEIGAKNLHFAGLRRDTHVIAGGATWLARELRFRRPIIPTIGRLSCQHYLAILYLVW